MRPTQRAVYAGGPLGPDQIEKNVAAVRQAGWTTIILGLFHIGRDEIPGQTDGDIIFNNLPTMTSGAYVADPHWPGDIAALMQGPSTIQQIYASFGGGSPVEDYTTLENIYRANNDSFRGTNLENNVRAFRKTFPAITGVDIDCEEAYDLPSLVAFCELLIGVGFDVTFCPYADTDFWTQALAALEQSSAGSVKWCNLQCYDGGQYNNPADWAAAITKALPSFPTAGFIVPGDWTNDSPSQVASLLAGFGPDPAIGGGFIWNLDGILDGSYTMTEYVKAI